MISNRAIASLPLTAAACAAALLLTAGVARAQSTNAATGHGLAGVWFVQVTLRDCTTQTPMGTFNSLGTLHQGGTISESTTSPIFAVGQRGPGTGTWTFDGHQHYTQRLVALINFDTKRNVPNTPGYDSELRTTPGFYTGWSTVTHTVELTDANHATSSGTNEFYKADGTQYRAGCSTAEWVRFE